MTDESSEGTQPASQPQDQVVRRISFCQAHPEITTMCHDGTWLWEAPYPGEDNGTETIHGIDLRDVLDKLEIRFGVAR